MSSPPLRFLADESCDFTVVRALRSEGHDVIAVSEHTTRSVDRELIEQAYREKRILITEDKDFGAAERLVDEHASKAITETNRRILKSEVGARAILDLVEWYEGQWSQARDFKDELVELLDASKFGGLEYTPYDIFLKAIYTYFQDDLDTGGKNHRYEMPGVRSAVELAEFQDDAVKKARRILAKYDGVLIGDSGGMGKTWIGKKLLEDYAYHQRMKAVVICPASLREMWQRELATATIAARVLTQEARGQADGRLEINEYRDVDVVLVDESHNFRRSTTQRYENLSSIIAANQGRGRSGGRKKVILLTATPINNDIFDLYHQLTLFTQNNRSYFAAAGIGDMYRYFHAALQQVREEQASVALFNLLEEVVIRRTRPFIRKAYPNATIQGKPVRWPERRLRTVRYDLEATYEGIYERIVSGIERLQLAQYSLESFKRTGIERDEFEEGREQALVGIFKTRYLKRLESSIDAFRISVRRPWSKPSKNTPWADASWTAARLPKRCSTWRMKTKRTIQPLSHSQMISTQTKKPKPTWKACLPWIQPNTICAPCTERYSGIPIS
jgi:SNF2 family DNA or RNA helicase